MKHKFYTCDVFTRQRFGGNQLAVLPDATGLSDQQMQQIAREFNYSETTFVLPPEQGNFRRVRIFTPARELPFAGHPNVGTAFVLASTGELGNLETVTTIIFEEGAGLVPVSVRLEDDNRLWCELKAPQGLNLGQVVKTDLVAAALSLDPSEIRSDTHAPRVADVGFPFLFVEVTDTAALAKSHANLEKIEQLEQLGIAPDILLYTRTCGDVDIQARMFAPLEGVPEDPATGSANCALAALLTHCDSRHSGEFTWRIAQGIEMGRPSLMNARTQKQDGQVMAAFIGGHCVMVSEGTIESGDTL